MWYDLFSLFYDPILERTYRPFRVEAVSKMALQKGQTALDCPCGTGHCMDLLVEAVGANGIVLASDLSKGMLRKASKRATKAGWNQVHTLHASASELSSSLVEESIGQQRVDALICSLGLTVFPDWEPALSNLLALIKPGGRMVILDVFAANPTRHSKAVELVARADLSRKVWRPLESRCEEFERVVVSHDAKTFGGELYIASGTIQ